MKATGHRWLAAAGIAMVLALVFASYYDPHLMFALASQVWACF